MDATPVLERDEVAGRPSVLGHVRIARIDHWVKNVFVLPGIVVGLSLEPSRLGQLRWWNIVLGIAAVCLIASSNYVINEIMDAPFDRKHPTKWQRPVPSGQVSLPLAYVQWIALMIVGLYLAFTVALPLGLTLLALWIMGCVYNLPPVRTKDLPYVDVLSEGINNPIRMLAGWYLTETIHPLPASLLISYWMIGCYFMAIKRFAEYRDLGHTTRLVSYRKCFSYYTEQRLLISIVFYGCHAMLFLGAFIVRYRLELILAFPFIALVMAIYLLLGFKPDSPTQNPEGLYREPLLMVAVTLCAAVIMCLLFVDLPIMHVLFAPTGFEAVP